MSTSFSFTVRPPTSASSSRPNGNGASSGAGGSKNSRVGPPSRRMFEDADSGSEDEGFARSRNNGGSSREERVNGSGRSRSGAKAKDEPLVIPALPNRDWRESSRRVPTYKPETRQQQGEVVTHERTGDGPQRSGLRRIERVAKTDSDEEDVKPDAAALQSAGQSNNLNGHGYANGQGSNGGDTPDVKPAPEQLTLEQQALREILAGQPSSPSAQERAQREMVIAMESNRVLSESEALQRDIGALPEESTLEDFEAVPISAFGIAALRGMGWDPKSTDNVKAREVTRRPQLLGLGATPMKADIMPTHKKGDKGKDKRSYAERSGRGYNAAGLMVKKEREGSERVESGRSTPQLQAIKGSRGGSVEGDSDASKRRRDDDNDGREAKRRDDGERDRDGRRYETEEERARRKAKERERERDREGRRRDEGYDKEDRQRDRDRDRRDRDRDDRRRDDRDRDRYREKERDRDRDYDRNRRDRDRDRNDDRRR